ncbi:hypothetical protein OXYTRIMIC_200 [Oxytricha trifallax]|uniref:Uncharacterized protein n=1 Tax=Oxytricha trifallax TaxID=1172189 RepID=A0A073HYJ3_9SPIT|nr:hypothetical protein OXYTRIMIC_200 [Oxytricha trifallax]
MRKINNKINRNQTLNQMEEQKFTKQNYGQWNRSSEYGRDNNKKGKMNEKRRFWERETKKQWVLEKRTHYRFPQTNRWGSRVNSRLEALILARTSQKTADSVRQT